MSFAELKQTVLTLNEEERLELEFLLTHLSRRDDPEWQEELTRRHNRMKAGHFSTEEDLLRLHEERTAEGR